MCEPLNSGEEVCLLVSVRSMYILCMCIFKYYVYMYMYYVHIYVICTYTWIYRHLPAVSCKTDIQNFGRSLFVNRSLLIFWSYLSEFLEKPCVILFLATLLMPWLIHSCADSFIDAPRPIYSAFLRANFGIVFSWATVCVFHDWYIYVPWLIHNWTMTHSQCTFMR